MSITKDPFDDKMNFKPSTPTPKEVDVAGLIMRLAEIDDELRSRGIDPLVKEKDRLRKMLKDYMLAHEVDKTYDETSNHEGVLMQRFSDTWDVDVFEKMLSPAQRARYITEVVAEGAVKDGVKNGDLSRGKLEAEGAVTKTPGTVALYVRERKEEEDGG